jgi:hypothetical protein
VESIGEAAKALAPVIVGAFAVQQLLELLQNIPAISNSSKKKLILGAISLVIGIALTFGTGMRVLEPLEIASQDWMDAVVTGILLSAGTEGSNSILKILEYFKDKLKNGGDDDDGT